ncbi:MAG: sigma-70 family RNA polymerase sigma factor [Gammaproteobacteria bacterium]|nr:sigma-70 family RNA polymerase sigma factor [Gammaproteobacteria bacterium]
MLTQVPDDMLDKQARYQNLVEAYSPWLYRYAYWISGEKSAAEDLVQETFLRAWRFLDALKDEAAAKSWLTTILRRENARKFEKKSLEFNDVEIENLPNQHADFDTRPEVIALRIAMKKLPDKYREPLVLQVLEGYSLEEIAEIFNIPRNTVATRLHRARQKLRKQLEGKEDIHPLRGNKV